MFQLKLKQNLNLWNLIVTSRAFAWLVDVFFVLCLILFSDFYFEGWTLRQTKWIAGKWIVEMFQRHQHDHSVIDGCFHKNFKVHVSSSFSKQKKKLMFKETETFIF